MMRSMFSAVSALAAHQSKMDVIGNNIANVNTVGYKRGRMTFQETYTQTLQGASAPQGGLGGTNPRQVGLGVSIGSMDTIHTRGSQETTGIGTDLMINGEGFFVVSNDESYLNRSYTRAGNFYVDAAGNLVTSNGMKVLGYQAQDIGPEPKFSSTLEGLQISRNMTFPPKETSEVNLEGHLDNKTQQANSAKTVGTADDCVYKKEGDVYVLNPKFADSVAKEVEFKVYDNLGGAHTFKQAFIRVEDSTGTPKEIQYKVETFYVADDGKMHHATGAGAGGTVGGTSPTLKFDNDGKLTSTSNNIEKITLGEGFTNGAGKLEFDINLGTLAMAAGKSNISMKNQDGYAQGNLDSFEIGQSGVITGHFTNGLMCSIGQLALANFKNPEGLKKTDNNLFSDTANSGSPMIGKPGEGGFATLTPSSLEMSNVDLSREFTDMITTQRGFQANTRVISTTDEMLQELVNIKR